MREAPARVNRNKLRADKAGNQPSQKDIGCGQKSEPIANRWLNPRVTLANSLKGQTLTFICSTSTLTVFYTRSRVQLGFLLKIFYANILKVFGRNFKKEANMRNDMSKVVTERPRYGHSNRSKKTGLRIRRWDRKSYYNGEDGLDGPHRIKSSRQGQYGWDSKEFSDRIGPLKRFLQSQIGRHWDKIYSELAQTLDKRSLTGRHIWSHVWDYVERDCVIGDDQKVYRIYCKESHFGKQNEVYKPLYVHPKTGVLCEVKKRSKK